MGLFYLTLMFALMMANTAIYMVFFRKQSNIYIFLVFIVILTSGFGHWLLGFSTTTEEANIANKINYVGAAFIPLFMFLSLVEVCGIKIALWVRLIMVSLNCTVLAFALTVGFYPIYYESFEFVVTRGVGNYLATFGWGHDFFNVAVISSGILDAVVIVYAFTMRRTVSIKNIFAMFFTEIVTFSSFLLSRVLECDTLVMPLVYVLNQWLILYICMNVKWYDIENGIYESIQSENTYAYVSFASNGSYLGCNHVAEKMFPQIEKCRIDDQLDSNSELGKLFNYWIDEVKSGGNLKVFDFCLDERHFKCSLQSVRLVTRQKILLFKIEDDTNVQNYIESLGKSNNLLKKMVEKNTNVVHAIQEQMIVGMANMVESRDGNTGGHIKRTSQVVKIIVAEMRKDKTLDLTEKFYDALVNAAPMHDLGKIAIDDQILRKPGKFTKLEFEVMKTHAEKGAYVVENLLTGIEEPYFVQLSKNVAYYHHERWDGSGYPIGLSGEQIPLEARIMAVADVYDALVSRRCYKERFAFSEADDIILSSMGTQFDPQMKKYFMNCSDLLKKYYISVDH